MYESSQNKKPSWTPTTVQKKGKSPSKLGHFSIQPQPHHTSTPSQEIGEYSRDSADRLTANVMRSLQTREQEIAEESIQPKFQSPWASGFEPPTPLPESPASKLKGAFAPVSENQIQRQCAECAREMVEQKREKRKDLDETGIQTKLTIGAPGDAYEQEADQVAAQVMSMPDNSPHVQKYSEANYTNEIWQRAQSIKPVVQRVVDPSVEMGQMVQRAHQMGGNHASGDLESRLNASKGGGSPLSENVKGFMEPRFGADFSGVRVHTGGEAVQMNQELGAQAFTHGSDVYFGQGKEPGNNELTAHELTHVMQQTDTISLSQDQSINEYRELLDAAKSDESNKELWKNVAKKLSNFAPEIISQELKRLSRKEIAKIHRGALDHSSVGSDFPIVKLTRAEYVAYLDVKYKGFIKSKDWGKAAVVLNGFSDSDILTRLKALSVNQLIQMNQNALSKMPGWSDRVTKPMEPLFAQNGINYKSVITESLLKQTQIELIAKSINSKKRRKWHEVNAIIKVIDKNGKVIYSNISKYPTKGEGKNHAEQVGIKKLLTSGILKQGYTLIVMVDQLPCDENCTPLMKKIGNDQRINTHVYTISMPDAKKPGYGLRPKEALKKTTDPSKLMLIELTEFRQVRPPLYNNALTSSEVTPTHKPGSKTTAYVGLNYTKPIKVEGPSPMGMAKIDGAIFILEQLNSILNLINDGKQRNAAQAELEKHLPAIQKNLINHPDKGCVIEFWFTQVKPHPESVIIPGAKFEYIDFYPAYHPLGGRNQGLIIPQNNRQFKIKRWIPPLNQQAYP